MRKPFLTLLGLGLGCLPVAADDMPEFEIEFRPGAGAPALQRFVSADYSAEAGDPAYAGFTVTLKPGLERLRLPSRFSGTLRDLMVATGCLSKASPVVFAPSGVTFVSAPDPDPGVCQRWITAESPEPVQEKTP